MTGRVRVRTGARLHFGLLDVQPPFGGVGAMIDDPATEVEATVSREFVCPTHRDRIEPIAERIARQLGIPGLPAVTVNVIRRPPAHHGLGSGTQLALAAAEAMIRVLDPTIDPMSVAGRGNRSCVGIHGFANGGWIDERSEDPSRQINPVRTRLELPGSWSVVLLTPRAPAPVISGDDENQQFAALSATPIDVHHRMTCLIDREMIPAARERDLDRFGEAVYQYNRISGDLFAPVQGGTYQSPAVGDLIAAIRRAGITGVGQSSWGPGVFVIATDSQLEGLLSQVSADANLIARTRFRNHPREVWTVE